MNRFFQWNTRDLLWLMVVVSILCMKGITYKQGVIDCRNELRRALAQSHREGYVIVCSAEELGKDITNPVSYESWNGKEENVIYLRLRNKPSGYGISGYVWTSDLTFDYVQLVGAWAIGCVVSAIILLILAYRFVDTWT